MTRNSLSHHHINLVIMFFPAPVVRTQRQSVPRYTLRGAVQWQTSVIVGPRPDPRNSEKRMSFRWNWPWRLWSFVTARSPLKPGRERLDCRHPLCTNASASEGWLPWLQRFVPESAGWGRRRFAHRRERKFVLAEWTGSSPISFRIHGTGIQTICFAVQLCIGSCGMCFATSTVFSITRGTETSMISSTMRSWIPSCDTVRATLSSSSGMGFSTASMRPSMLDNWSITSSKISKRTWDFQFFNSVRRHLRHLHLVRKCLETLRGNVLHVNHPVFHKFHCAARLWYEQLSTVMGGCIASTTSRVERNCRDCAVG